MVWVHQSITADEAPQSRSIASRAYTHSPLIPTALLTQEADTTFNITECRLLISLLPYMVGKDHNKQMSKSWYGGIYYIMQHYCTI